VSRKLYIGNLPPSATESRLSKKFSEHGSVVGVKLITNRITGLSLGYAFVEMETPAQATDAITKLDGEPYDGWRVTVRTATPQRK
jgi:RNA recognition motif-containing protein